MVEKFVYTTIFLLDMVSFVFTSFLWLNNQLKEGDKQHIRAVLNSNHLAIKYMTVTAAEYKTDLLKYIATKQIYGFLKGAMELHDARIRRRSKHFLKSAPNTIRGRTIYHEMQHIHGERGEQSTQNKLIMLLPTKKRRADGRGRTSKIVKNMRWLM